MAKYVNIIMGLISKVDRAILCGQNLCLEESPCLQCWLIISHPMAFNFGSDSLRYLGGHSSHSLSPAASSFAAASSLAFLLRHYEEQAAG